MKKLFLILALLFSAFLSFKCYNNLITTPGDNQNSPLTTSEQKLVSSSELFGLNLFKSVNNYEGNKNIFISPLSVSMALGMTLNGAIGSTYDSMKTVLELNGLTQQEINESYKSLISLLTNMDPKVIFSIANSIWYESNMTFEQDFINQNKNYFNAEISALNFSDPNSVNIINDWVNQNTNGKITDIIEKIPREMVMYLINAIYFKGDWKYQFDKDKTNDDYFTTSSGSQVTCKMMRHQTKLSYFDNDLFQAVDLPYGDSTFFMTIFLPKYNIELNSVISQLNRTNLQSWLSSFTSSKVILLMPKFELEYKLQMNDVLKSMGMEIAFSGNADFTNMFKPGGLFISEVMHKSYLKVDEVGTEAAAVTSVGVGRSIGNPGFYMKVNKPFLFVIRERNSNSILFMGKVVGL